MEIRYIMEWCPTTRQVVGQIAVTDELGEDCNFFDALKDYRINQRGSNPYVSACGAVLIPLES